jgi:hypothetical protein
MGGEGTSNKAGRQKKERTLQKLFDLRSAAFELMKK